MKFKHFIPGLVFLVIALVLASVTGLQNKANFYPTMIGQDAPKFKTATLRGDVLDSEELKDNVILNFWASWCVACKAEHQALLELADEGYKLYGINSADQKAKAVEYLDKYKNPFLKNGIDKTRKIAIAFGVTGMPETFVIGRDGKIYFHYRGALTDEIINTQLKPIVEGLEAK